MNFGKDESFFIKHQYFFQNYYFQFEGLSDEIRTDFTDVVQRLSGKICKDADYILTEKSYFQKKENRHRNDLYSIFYILDSMKAKKPLDITKYRFKSEESYQSMTVCCLFSKYILRTNSCARFYYDNLYCRMCKENKKEKTDESISINVENRSENNINNILSHTEIVENNNVNIETSNLPVNCHASNKDERKNNIPRLHNISQRKGDENSLSKNLYVNYLNIENEGENSTCKKFVSDGKLNRNYKLSTVSLSDDETNESAKKLKMSDRKSIKIQHVNENSKFKIYSKNRVGNSKICGLKKVETATAYPTNKDNFLSQNKLEINSNEEINENSRRLNKESKYKKIKNPIKSNDSSRSLSDSTSIHDEISRQLRKPKNKEMCGKRQHRHNIPLNNNSSSSSEDEINKSKKIRTFNPIKIIKMLNIKSEKNHAESDKKNESSDGELSFYSDDEINENKTHDWWYNLPEINNINSNFVEPKRNLSVKRRGTTFNLKEQRIMIAYLIKKKIIQYGSSRLPWREMHNDGYMRHRSVESLNNHFRRVILPNIHKFDLPTSIVKQFLSMY